MMTFDFAPLFPATVGFDRLFELLEAASEIDGAGFAYPPCDIERTGAESYRLSMAVAGFDREDLDIEVAGDILTVTGRKLDEPDDIAYLHRGIARRSFRQSFHLADYVEVVGAHLAHGMLSIELERTLPEALRPRRIEISTSAPARLIAKAKKLISGKKAA